MTLLADCLISFGLCMAVTAIFSLPNSYVLIVQHRQRIGWLGPGGVVAGLACAAVGFYLCFIGAAQ